MHISEMSPDDPRASTSAARRATKPRVTQAHVDTLMNAMTPEGRAHVAMLATHRLCVRPATWPTK
jgi:hypothetical protein